MFRKNINDLITWKNRVNRRPLVVRGARQVGKTYLIREFSKEFVTFLEINFDETPGKSNLFEAETIEEIIKLLEIEYKIKITPGQTLIFLDEIQAAPKVLAKLRYFYETMPDLHIISAGSLLDFTLANHEFSMPVGRIEYMFIGPMTYGEFLLANEEEELLEYLNKYNIKKKLPISIHEKCLKYLKYYFYVGGMPSSVKAFSQTKDLNLVSIEHNIILQTIADDFNKYQKKINIQLLQNVFYKLPKLIGKKLKYVNINQNERAKDLAIMLNLLRLAKIIYLVKHSSGNGLPLSSESNDKNFKPLFLDIGLMLSSLNLSITDIHNIKDLTLINAGALAEQFIGQHLLFRDKCFKNPELYYWNREAIGSSSEIDYLISHNSKIIPVEVKSGKTGSLKSIQVFVSKKKSKYAVRFNSDLPSLITTKTNIHKLNKIDFDLISLPMYLIENLDRILNECFCRTI